MGIFSKKPEVPSTLKLGQPIPNSEHAVSVALPEWRDVVGYEEGEARVTEQLQLGYPRFVIHPLVQQLFDYCQEKYAYDGESCFAFPSHKVAARAISFLKLNKVESRMQKIPKTNIFAVFCRSTEKSNDNFSGKQFLKAYWQHSGEVISSRYAEKLLSFLNQKSGNNPTDELAFKSESEPSNSKKLIKEKIAKLAGEEEKNIYLFPSGMAAIFFAHRLLKLLCSKNQEIDSESKTEPEIISKTIQFGFPYVDTLKIQEKFSSTKKMAEETSVHFFHKGDEQDLKALEKLLQEKKDNEKIAGLFTEFPTNPLLRSVDLDKLRELAQTHKFPVVVDDTISTFANTNLSEKADIVVTSLTKFFSGTGNVMAGSMIISPKSKFYEQLSSLAESEFEDLLWTEDADVLWQNCQAFEQRMEKINKNTEALCDFLSEHPLVHKVYYPKFIDSKTYRKNAKPNAGFGGLFSLELKDAEKNAPIFYNNLNVAKGPSLGTNYTLACPYTLLAHYQELNFVEQCGVSRNLIRVSVGTENTSKLIEVFKSAFLEIIEKGNYY